VRAHFLFEGFPKAPRTLLLPHGCKDLWDDYKTKEALANMYSSGIKFLLEGFDTLLFPPHILISFVGNVHP